MLSINIISVGKLKEEYLKNALSEYKKRLTKLCNLKETEINEFKLEDEPSLANIEKGLKNEATNIIKYINSNDFVIALCIEGAELSSFELSTLLEKTALSGKSNIIFIIGSSYGLHNEIKQRADFCLSFSKMTFPHQLMRVMLIEQIYRAFSISKNTNYHK